MWLKAIAIIFLFYFFAILQNSFFIHFNLFGAVPDLVFTLFLLLIFFAGKKINYTILFYALVSGLFLDIFSYTYLGVSVILLIAIGYLAKKTQLSLSERGDKYPFVYFVSLFIVSFAVYSLFLGLFFYFMGLAPSPIDFSLEFLFKIIYSLFLASILFWIYKKFMGGATDNRQLPLFKR
jgi:cell shape-determining protein MreD